jgi:hypothetical protein
MGRTRAMGLSLKRIFRSGSHKENKSASVAGRKFREAQADEAVKAFLEETRLREERLKREGLIHP